MKIRNGFVSNSSTTSFCIMGAQVDYPDFSEDHEYYDWDMYDICDENGLECYSPEYRSGYFVGLSAQNIDEDETLKQFKNRVLENMKKVGIDVEYENLEWIEEAYYS